MFRVAWILVLAPLVVVALKLTVLDPNAKNISCSQAQEEFEAQDFGEVMPSEPVLLLGNRRVMHWSRVPQKFGNTVVLKRTTAGLSPNNLDACFPRLVGHYQPRSILLFIDTGYALTVTPSDVLSALEGIMDQRAMYELRFELAIIAPIASPRLSSSDRQTLARLNNSLSSWSASKLGTRFISVDHLFQDVDGEVSPKHFWPDGNTLTDRGYAILSDMLVTSAKERKKEFTGIVSK